jgi:hypothetical protein
MKYDWASAKNLSYGPHTLVATAVDEAKNVGRAEIKVTHVGGGAYPFKVPTKYALSAGRSVRARSPSAARSRRRAATRAGPAAAPTCRFSRFDTKAKRWKRYSRYSRSASSPFKVRYTFRKRGVWRVTGLFKPQTGYKKATAKTTKFKVR